ncbi:MAG: RNB domain-containing ribonuclease [Nitriliruptoraceae bacterium]
MHVFGRFRPHARGFGFLHLVAEDGWTPAEVTVPRDGGPPVTADRVFVPPATARGLVSDDLVRAEVDADDKGISAERVEVQQRPRRLLVGRVVNGPGRTVLEPVSELATGWLELDDAVVAAQAVATGRVVVVLRAEDDDGAPTGRALVAGGFVAGSPAAVRAISAVVTLDRVAPDLVAGGPAAAGLDAQTATMTHIRLVGRLAGGGRGAAAGLDTDGPIPGSDLVATDRRDEPAITIDDAGARDLDDALTATWPGSADDAVTVAVHIADAAGAVGVGSPADNYARTVAATAYLAVGDNAPMLDPVLAEDRLSLHAGADRTVVSVRFAVEADGAVTSPTIELAQITSRAQLSYAAVEHWLAGDSRSLASEHDTTVLETLGAITEASRRLGIERDRRVTFERLFASATVTPALVDGRLTVAEAEPHANAYRLVERLMVAANEAVATALVAAQIPALYRTHAGLDPQRLARVRAAAELAGATIDGHTDDAEQIAAQLLAAIDTAEHEGRTADRDLLIAVATGATARASYDPDPTHHRGLAADAYTHFTSPIRRYADLVVHRQLRAMLAGTTPPYDIAELAPLAGWLDARAGALQHLEARERTDLWAQLLDRGFLTESEPATITGLTVNGLRIRLSRLGLSGFVTAERALGLPPRQRGQLVVDEHGLTTTSGPWRVGSRVAVRFVGLDDTSRPIWRLDE